MQRRSHGPGSGSGESAEWKDSGVKQTGKKRCEAGRVRERESRTMANVGRCAHMTNPSDRAAFAISAFMCGLTKNRIGGTQLGVEAPRETIRVTRGLEAVAN